MDLEIRDLTIEYSSGGQVVRPVNGLNLTASTGSLVLLLGPSGCGKTTLLSCLGGILAPTRGHMQFGDTDISALSGKTLTEYRRHTVGIVFQAFNLVPSLTTLENVMVPMCNGGMKRRERTRARDRAARPRSGSPSACTTVRARSPAVSNNASRSHARSASIPRCCSPTSRPRTSTTSRSRAC